MSLQVPTSPLQQNGRRWRNGKSESKRDDCFSSSFSVVTMRSSRKKASLFVSSRSSSSSPHLSASSLAPSSPTGPSDSTLQSGDKRCKAAISVGYRQNRSASTLFNRHLNCHHDHTPFHHHQVDHIPRYHHHHHHHDCSRRRGGCSGWEDLHTGCSEGGSLVNRRSNAKRKRRGKGASSCYESCFSSRLFIAMTNMSSLLIPFLIITTMSLVRTTGLHVTQSSQKNDMTLEALPLGTENATAAHGTSTSCEENNEVEGVRDDNADGGDSFQNGNKLPLPGEKGDINGRKIVREEQRTKTTITKTIMEGVFCGLRKTIRLPFQLLRKTLSHSSPLLRHCASWTLTAVLFHCLFGLSAVTAAAGPRINQHSEWGKAMVVHLARLEAVEEMLMESCRIVSRFVPTLLYTLKMSSTNLHLNYGKETTSFQIFLYNATCPKMQEIGPISGGFFGACIPDYGRFSGDEWSAAIIDSICRPPMRGITTTTWNTPPILPEPPTATNTSDAFFPVDRYLVPLLVGGFFIGAAILKYCDAFGYINLKTPFQSCRRRFLSCYWVLKDVWNGRKKWPNWLRFGGGSGGDNNAADDLAQKKPSGRGTLMKSVMADCKLFVSSIWPFKSVWNLRGGGGGGLNDSASGGEATTPRSWSENSRSKVVMVGSPPTALPTPLSSSSVVGNGIGAATAAVAVSALPFAILVLCFFFSKSKRRRPSGKANAVLVGGSSRSGKDDMGGQ